MIYIAALYAVVSVITYITYVVDKKAAIKNRRRVSEKLLHLLALAGGWPGALLAQQRWRHKTQKTSFRVVFWLMVIANLACLVGFVLYPYSG
ncbi:DUF1294 domain-containing protein [Halomonas sp. AOP5-B2-8]